MNLAKDMKQKANDPVNQNEPSSIALDRWSWTTRKIHTDNVEPNNHRANTPFPANTWMRLLYSCLIWKRTCMDGHCNLTNNNIGRNFTLIRQSNYSWRHLARQKAIELLSECRECCQLFISMNKRVNSSKPYVI